MSAAGELPILAIVDALEGGVSIDALAAQFGTTPVGLVVAGVRWLATHCDECTAETHSRVCAVLATSLDPDGPLSGGAW